MLREILRKSEWVLVGGKWTRVSVGFKALVVFNSKSSIKIAIENSILYTFAEHILFWKFIIEIKSVVLISKVFDRNLI